MEAHLKVFANYFFKLRFVQIEIFFGMFGRSLEGAKHICVKLICENFKENRANIFIHSYLARGGCWVNLNCDIFIIVLLAFVLFWVFWPS